MTKPLHLALLLALAALFSCNDSDDDAPINRPIPKIKTITHYTGSQGNSENYEYDQLGRIQKVTYSPGSYDVYEYRTDTIFKKIYFESLSYVTTDTLLLNNQGLVIRSNFGIAEHEYYPEGYLANSTFLGFLDQGDMSMAWKISGGNTIQCEIFQSRNGKLELANTYDYAFYTDKINTIGNDNMGMSFWGKQDKNLVSSSKYRSHFIDDRNEVTYTYELDAQNRVVKKKEVGSPEKVYKEYSYYE